MYAVSYYQITRYVERYHKDGFADRKHYPPVSIPVRGASDLLADVNDPNSDSQSVLGWLNAGPKMAWRRFIRELVENYGAKIRDEDKAWAAQYKVDPVESEPAFDAEFAQHVNDLYASADAASQAAKEATAVVVKATVADVLPSSASPVLVSTDALKIASEKRRREDSDDKAGPARSKQKVEPESRASSVPLLEEDESTKSIEKVAVVAVVKKSNEDNHEDDGIVPLSLAPPSPPHPRFVSDAVVAAAVPLQQQQQLLSQPPHQDEDDVKEIPAHVMRTDSLDFKHSRLESLLPLFFNEMALRKAMLKEQLVHLVTQRRRAHVAAMRSGNAEASGWINYLTDIASRIAIIADELDGFVV